MRAGWDDPAAKRLAENSISLGDAAHRELAACAREHAVVSVVGATDATRWARACQTAAGRASGLICWEHCCYVVCVSQTLRAGGGESATPRAATPPSRQ